jgi:FKBP-type peptidyl-prolyl cis-trans isomerase 2
MGVWGHVRPPEKVMPLGEIKDIEGPLLVGEFISFDDDEELCWIVTEIMTGKVYLYANNAWAGKTLQFNIEIDEIRLPTGEELMTRRVMKSNANTFGPGCRC